MLIDPLLYDVLLDRATTGPQEDVTARLDAAIRAMVAGLAPEVLDALRYAYSEGLRDGFAQGAAAASPEAQTAPAV